ncbi:hypothetical protein ABW20_dc0110491 [Dactylellina cionopaga]|nr:hypothetical protein ABW20_dc0110491 [Dactylellina cionopaga]
MKLTATGVFTPHLIPDCTFLTVRRKRGPKGPRRATGEKIQQLQDELISKRLAVTNTHSEFADPQRNSKSENENSKPAYEDYVRYIEIFRQRLYSVWPVLDCESLVKQLAEDQNDFEAHALAASLCSAVIAQLRLPEHGAEKLLGAVTSFEFAEEAQLLRRKFEYRETYSTASVLTSFFLHIYYANAEKLRSAGFFLREAIGCAQGLQMEEPEIYHPIWTQENQLKLRIFWVLFISERTYCIQNGLPMVLQAIDYLPELVADASQDKNILSAFVSLTQLFFYLDSGLARALRSYSSKTCASCPGYHKEGISAIQNRLCDEENDNTLRESQKVDIMVTRQWVRTLVWQYTISRFAVSCNSEDLAFSSLLPITIAKETLSIFSKVSTNSIKTHGYGIEIKVHLLADTLLDVLICVPATSGGHSMLFGARDALNSLEHLLLLVGGPASPFLQGLRERMAKVEFPAPWSRWLDPTGSESDDSESISS